MMQLYCSHCREPIPPEQIQIQAMLALCPACGTLFPFTESDLIVASHKRKRVPQPDHIRRDDDGLSLTLTLPYGHRKWDRQSGLGCSILMLLTADFFLLLPLLYGTTTKSSLTFPVLLLLMGMVMLFFTLMTRVRLSLTPESLKQRVRPFPFSDGVKLDRDEVMAVYCEESSKTRESTQYDEPMYNLFAVMRDNRERLLIGRLAEDDAQYLAQELQRQLDRDRESARLLDDLSQRLSERRSRQARFALYPAESTAQTLMVFSDDLDWRTPPSQNVDSLLEQGDDRDIEDWLFS